MDSHFAPAQRQNHARILEQFKSVEDAEFVKQLLNALPYVVTIINQERQIVFSNEALLNIMNIPSMEIILGQRPGEVVSCIYSSGKGGCGTSENCKVCGAVRSILRCQETKSPVYEECKITSRIDGKQVNFEFLAASSPFRIGGEEYIIFSLTDISSEKRRKAIEKIFFHDLMNIAGNLKGFIDLMRRNHDPEKITEYIQLAGILTSSLMDNLNFHKELFAAEKNDLKVNFEQINTEKCIKNVVENVRHLKESHQKKITVSSDTINQNIRTDNNLLMRVLVNMLKNALEASHVEETVAIGCRKNGERILFWVHNHNFIPERIQLQLFQRSYSTKGSGRGLGTYSMKLIGEQYLGGKVYFTSTPEKGTTFFLEIPG